MGYGITAALLHTASCQMRLSKDEPGVLDTERRQVFAQAVAHNKAPRDRCLHLRRIDIDIVGDSERSSLDNSHQPQ